MDKLTVHSYDWRTGIDQETGYTVIYSWCLNKNSDAYLLRFHEFPVFCYVELPLFLNNSYVSWSDYKVKKIYEQICKILGDEHKPYKCRLEMKQKYYYYKGKDKKYPMLLLCFRNIESMKKCKNMLKRAFKVYGLKGGRDETMVAVNVWETHIPLERKLLTLRNCKFSQWFNIKGMKVKGDDKISTLENEYVVDWKTLDPISLEDTISWMTHPKILSFDIETYSDRHNAMPDSLCSKHVVYMISVVFQRFLKPETRKKEIILYGDCSHTDLANVIKVKTELELIDVFQNLVLKYDPEVTVGYNILGYDNFYLENRLKRNLKEWKPLGRILNEPSEMVTVSWSSSAFKNQDFNILEMNGRITIDLLPVIRRDYKLPVYKLDYIANKFLGKCKHDVTAKQMFATYELQKCLNEDYIPDEPSKEYFKHCRKLDNKDEDKDGKIDVEYNEYVKERWKNEYKTFALDEMKKVVDYCIVDSDLVVDLFDKINVWIGLIQISNIMGIVPADIFTRGTGIRMQSQIYDEASKNNIVLDEVDFPKINYEGGLVPSPQIGIHHLIPIYDYKSLYPSVQIAYNMDHSSFVPPHLMDQIPDEDCHIVEWDDEVGVENDNNSDTESDTEGEEDDESPKKKKIVHKKYKFVKEPVGIMPKLLKQLIAERNKVRKRQKEVPSDSLEWNVLEQTQLGIKCSSNAFYGSCGSSFSRLKFPYIGEAITAKARESTRKMNSYIEARGHTVVYGDTDSTMPNIGLTDPKTAWEISEKLAKELTALVPRPMEVELEAIFHTMLSIKKKMYLCIYLDKNGEPIDRPDAMKIRGVTLARRDNCQFQRDFYRDTVWKVLHEEPFIDLFNFIIDKCIQLLSHSVYWKDLTMIKGLGSHYKSENYMMCIFSKEMAKSGNPMTPGDRIEYVVVQTDNKDDKVGYKMRTTDLFLERAVSENPEKIDCLYYLENVVRNGIERQLYQVGYKKQLEELEKKFIDLDCEKVLFELAKIIGDLDPQLKELRIKGVNKTVLELMNKFNNDKLKVVEYLLEDDSFKKYVKPLYTYYVKRRKGRKRRLSTRIDKEPIMMMVRLAEAKAEVMKSIREYVKPKKVITLKIVG